MITLSLFSSDPNPAKNRNIEETIAITWEKLPEIVITRNWSPAVFENQARSLANYKEHPSLIAFDIDEGMTLDEAVKEFQPYTCLITTSRNHQKIKHQGTPSEKPACDRFRVILKLAEPILSDDDFRATWDSFKDLYPLDKQTRSASMFFFKGREVIFNNPNGKLVEIIRNSDWQGLKTETYSFQKDEKGGVKGVLSRRTQEFLRAGAVPGMFNMSLFKCAVDFLEQRYTQEEFLDRISQSVLTGAMEELDDTDLATVRSAFNREPKYGTRTPGKSQVDAQKQDITDRIMNGEFIQCVQPDATIWYKITDYENQEVERVANPQILERHISNEIKKPENHYNSSQKSTDEETGKVTFKPITKTLTVKEVLDIWRLDGEAISQLAEPILWRGARGWCHKRFNFDCIPGLPHPHWDQFLKRLSEPEIFMAWVYSCFVPEHETRQALWLYGKTGEDGKTKVVNLIAEQFGQAAASITSGQITSDSRFTLSQFLGKRLAVYSDCMKPGFPKTEIFRNLTGGDHVTMEFKNGGFLHGSLKLKVMIASNFEPEMTSGGYDQSRILFVEVEESKQKNDPSWPKHLREELPAFLGDCQVAFKKLCHNGGKIEVPEAVKTRLGDIAEHSEEDFQLIFEMNFKVQEPGVVGPKGENLDRWVSSHEVWEIFKGRGYHSGDIAYQMKRFKIFLEQKYGIMRRRKASDHKNYYYRMVMRDPGRHNQV